MVNVTFAVSEELHRIMKQHNEIKWSAIARHAIAGYAEKLKEEPNFLKVLKEGRKQEEAELLKKAEGNEAQAYALWLGGHKKRISAMRTPNWWKNAASPL